MKELVEAGAYAVGQHASERLEERGLLEWQIVDGLLDSSAKLLIERPDSLPNPSIEVLQLLPDGTQVKAVWSKPKSGDFAKLVTVHFLDL